jgi:hypothetical protein
MTRPKLSVPLARLLLTSKKTLNKLPLERF